MNLGKHKILDDRTTDHVQVGYIYWHAKRVLPRRTLYHDIHEKKRGGRINSYETNNPGISPRLTKNRPYEGVEIITQVAETITIENFKEKNREITQTNTAMRTNLIVHNN